MNEMRHATTSRAVFAARVCATSRAAFAATRAFATSLATHAASAASAACLPVAMAALVAFAPVQPAAAQGGERFRIDLKPRVNIRGLTQAQAVDWNRSVDRVAELLREHPDVNAPPDGVCTLLASWVGEFVVESHMASYVTVQIPPTYSAASGCARVSNEAVTVHLNDTGGFLLPQLAGMTDEDWAQLHVMPLPAGTRGGASVFLDAYSRWIVLTHGRAPLADTLSHEEYLRHRIAEMSQAGAASIAARLRARLDALSSEERAAPACFDANDLVASLARCGERGRAHVRLNRAYFDTSLPASAVQLIVVTSPQEIRGKEDPRHYALRTRIFESLDYGALADLLAR